MTKQEVLDSLKHNTKKFPKEAIKEIQANKDDYIPELLESLDYMLKNIKELYDNANKDNYYFLPTYAMYLLAEFREKRAFPILTELMRLPEDYVDYVFGDTLTGDLDNILLCTFDDSGGGHMQMLFDIIESQELFEWARVAALDAYALLYMEGYVSQEDFISYIRSLIYDKLIDDESEVVNTAIAGCIIDTHTFQMIPDARFLHESDKVDRMMHGDYDGFLDLIFNKDWPIDEPRYIDNTIDKMEWWACFEKEDKNKKAVKELLKKDSKPPKDALGDFMAEMMKIDREKEMLIAQKKNNPERNDPCPCGSGKKYKKCCIDKENTAVVSSAPPPVARIEDKYDLLKDYPKDSPLFNELYEKEAVDIDKLVYKALHHRAIPIWVKRNLEQERLGKIDYLNEALKLFTAKCAREQITSFAAYDEKYMVHYRSDEWVSTLIDLTKEDTLPGIVSTRKKALDIFRKFEK